MVSGGVRRSTRLARGADEQPALEAGRDHVGRRRSSSAPSEQAEPASLGDAGSEASAAVSVRAARRTWLSSSSSISSQTAHGRGAGDRIAAEGRGVVAGREARPRTRRRRAGSRSAGRSRAPSRASQHRVARRAARSEEAAGAADAGLHLVEDEQRTELIRELARGREERGRQRGGRRPRPSTGSSRMQPVASPTAAASELASSGRAKRTPGTSGSKAARFSGWPVTASAPSVRPWNEPSSATMPGLPVALRAYLSAASSPLRRSCRRTPPRRRSGRTAARRAAPSAPSSRGSTRARAARAARGRRRAVRGGRWPSPTTAIPARKSR